MRLLGSRSRPSDHNLQHKHRRWSHWGGAESDGRGLPGEGKQDPEGSSGPGLGLGPWCPHRDRPCQIHRALGSVCCSLLKVWSASRECLEMSYRSDYTWAFGRAAFNWRVPGQRQAEESRGALGSGTKRLIPTRSGPCEEQEVWWHRGWVNLPLHPTLSITAHKTCPLEMDRHLEFLCSLRILSNPQPNSPEV